MNIQMKIRRLHEQLDSLGRPRPQHQDCDCTEGMRDGARCQRCWGAGQFFRADGRAFPNTLDGYYYACLACMEEHKHQVTDDMIDAGLSVIDTGDPYCLPHRDNMAQVYRAMRALEEIPKGEFQSRVRDWMMACFGEEISQDQVERNHRFLEESLELVQSCGCTKAEAQELIDYVFDRPMGQKDQEVGGTVVTLTALCLAQSINLHEASERELARVWLNIDKIRAKQAAKPKFSARPE